MYLCLKEMSNIPSKWAARRSITTTRISYIATHLICQPTWYMVWCVFKLLLLWNKQIATTFWLRCSHDIFNDHICCLRKSVCQSDCVPVCLCASLSVCLPVSTRPVYNVRPCQFAWLCAIFGLDSWWPKHVAACKRWPIKLLTGPVDLLVQSPCHCVNRPGGLLTGRSAQQLLTAGNFQ